MAAITCFNNYIGIRGYCSDTTPISGLYVNDLAGIELKMISNLANQEQQSFKGVWDEIYSRSVAEMEGDILVGMQRFFKPKILLENNLFGYYLTPNETEASDDKKKGIAIDLLSSKNMALFINSVELYTASAITDAIRIYDFNTGVLLDTIAYTSVAGSYNKIQINKSYEALGQRKKIFISYNSNLTASIKTGSLPYFENQPYYPITRGASISNASSVIENNMTFDSNTFGLVINYNVTCSIQNFICSNRDFFKTALWYKLGENLMTERMTSSRINQYTMVNMERAKELKDMFVEKYKEQMVVVLNNLEPEGDDICFPCEKKRTFKYNLP